MQRKLFHYFIVFRHGLSYLYHFFQIQRLIANLREFLLRYWIALSKFFKHFGNCLKHIRNMNIPEFIIYFILMC